MTKRRAERRDTVATGAVAVPGYRVRPDRTAERGYSLIEMVVAIMVVGVLISMGVPRFSRSMEQARANVAGANLQAIWSAQRLYWLENRTYAADLATLQSLTTPNFSPLIDPSLVTAVTPYTYVVTSPDDGNTFTATATRANSSGWSGSWTIDQNGNTSGAILKAGHATPIVLGFQ
jgi:prepilin-type N-terminal cleavage/methylation domain-containing protein